MIRKRTQRNLKWHSSNRDRLRGVDTLMLQVTSQLNKSQIYRELLDVKSRTGGSILGVKLLLLYLLKLAMFPKWHVEITAVSELQKPMQDGRIMENARKTKHATSNVSRNIYI